MSDEEVLQTRVPAQVLALALRARTDRVPHPNPISWRVEKAYTVIVFEDGRKLTFEQVPTEADEIQADYEATEELPEPAAPDESQTIAFKKRRK